MSERNVTPGKFNLPVKPWIIIVGIIVILVGSGVFTSVYTVDVTEKVVILRLGKYKGTYEAGLHTKLPFGIDKAIIVPVKSLTMEFGYETQRADVDSVYKRSNNPQRNEMLTGDLNIINVEWSVIYEITDPYKYLFNVDDPIQTIQDISESVINRLVGDTAILGILGGERKNIGDLAKIEMQLALGEKTDKNPYAYDMGITITLVDLQSTTHTTEKVQNAFKDVTDAEQNMNQLINEGKEEYNKIIPKAKGEASKIVLDAEAYAAERVNRAIGDVARFNAVKKEYRKNPEVTMTRLYIEMSELIYGQAGSITLIDKSLINNALILKNLTSTGGVK